MSTTLERPVVTKEGVPGNMPRINKFLDQRIEYMKVRDRL